MTEASFKALSTEDRWKLIKQNGEFIGNRQSGEHFISLFAVNGLFVEVWMPVGLNCMRYIEIQKSDAILQEYYNQISLKNLGK
jgi:hypothetical protein